MPLHFNYTGGVSEFDGNWTLTYVIICTTPERFVRDLFVYLQ